MYCSSGGSLFANSVDLVALLFTFEVQQLSEQDTAELTVFAASLRFAGEEQG